MSLSKQKNMPSYDFPEEILSEVFKRLPVKYVLRCGAVQKSWYSLIKSPIFISLHSSYQKLTARINPKYLLFHNISTRELTVCSDDVQCQQYCTCVYPLELPACSWYTQSNGLICMSNLFNCDYRYNPEIFIWNPLVQKFKIVPESPLSAFQFKETEWNAIAFGFLTELNDYVLIHIVKPCSTSGSLSFSRFDPNSHVNYEQYPHSIIIGVYSLNTNSWKEICQDKVFVDCLCTDQSVIVNGTAFWVGYNFNELYQVIMCFDTKANILRTIRVPESTVLGDRQILNPLILPFGQSIAYFVVENNNYLEEDYWSPQLHIWVFKDNVIGEFSWEMSVILSKNVRAKVLGTRNNGDPILAKSNSFIAYDLDTHEPYDFVESCDHLTPDYDHEGSPTSFVIHPFVETLVLLDSDSNN